jgi:RecA-family ATPase
MADTLAASLGVTDLPTFWSEPIAEGCAQLRELRDNAANQGRDSWWSCLGVLAHCQDGDRFAHAWSKKYAEYTFAETQSELDGWRNNAEGATRCETFDRKNPGICNQCPHWEKINSPISLGMRSPEGATRASPCQGPSSASSDERKEVEKRDFGTTDSSPHTQSSEKFGIFGDELLSTPAPARRWFVERFIPAEETTMFGGDGGVGKTTLALQLSVAAISNQEWLGLKVKQCNVLYVSAEDPEDEIHFRLEQITKHLRLSTEELARFKLLDLAGTDATIAVFDRDGQIKLTRLFSKIENAAREHNAGCIILDAVADFFGGGESERREVRAFVSQLRGLAMRLHAAVVFLAHPSVDGIKTGRGYSGSTHWNNAVRSRLYFTEAPQGDGQPPNPDWRMIELVKSNRARRGEKIHVMWTEGRFVEVTPGAIPNLTYEKEAEELFLQLLAKLDKQGIHVSPYRSNSYAPTMLAKQPSSKGIGKAALEGAMHRLLDQGKIRDEMHGPPSKRRHRLMIEGGRNE